MEFVGPRADGHSWVARQIAARITEACAERGRADVALSGGSTPEPMFDSLARALVDRPNPVGAELHLWQVDERVVAEGDPRRNWTAIDRLLAARIESIDHPMPVDDPNLAVAAGRYARDLPSAFDVVHLGLGADGHTASLVPGDPVLEVADRLVALAGPYEGTRRMTLTFPALARAHTIFMLVGPTKASALDRLLAGDIAIPAARIDATDMIVVATS